MNMKNCGGCCTPTVVLSTNPFTRGARYQCDCCSQMMQPNTAQYPAGGMMQGNAFVVLNALPFLIDNTQTDYGTKLSVSESVYTRISKRNDPSCLNMSGVVDMTNEIITNASWNAFLCDVTEQHYQELDGLLPIVKAGIKFTMYYRIEDGQGGVVFQGNKSVVVQKQTFHYTDINDYFLEASKGIIVLNVPQLTYQGVYNFVIERMEAHVAYLDTNALVPDHDLNPYYAFTDNNTKIAVMHDVIDGTVPVGELLIAQTAINQAFPFQANLTTRVRLSFTAFMSNIIACSDTSGVYGAMFNPTQKLIEELAHDVQVLSTSVTDLQIRMAAAEAKIEQLESPNLKQYALGVDLKLGDIVWNVPGTIFQATTAYTTAGETVQTALQADIDEGRLVLVGEIPATEVEPEDNVEG